MSEHITRAVIEWLDERYPDQSLSDAIAMLNTQERKRLQEFIALASRCPIVATILVQPVDQAATHAPTKRARRMKTKNDHQSAQAPQSPL